MTVVHEELHHQANYLRKLESTNVKVFNFRADRSEKTTNKCGGFERTGRWFRRRVQVFEELRAKVVRLEAEVEAGRRERENRYFFSFPSIFFVFVITNLDLFVIRANRFSNLTMPSLSELRLIHARRLEDHVSTTALLPHWQREAVIVELDRRQVEAQ